MDQPITLHPDRFTVTCQAKIVEKFKVAVDWKKCNEVSKYIYRQLVTSFLDKSESYMSDEVMMALAMMVVRFGTEMTELNPINEWESDGFPEFCSLISPWGGLVAIKRSKDPNDKGNVTG